MIELNEEVTEEVTDSVEETTDENTEQPVEEVVEETIDESKFDSAGDDSVIKIDLDSPPSSLKKEEEDTTKANVVEEVTEDTTKQVPEETPVMEEITEEKVEETAEPIEEVVEETIATESSLPENIQKVVKFMEETGGDLNDYVKLNRDIKEMDDSDVLDEYYKQTKSHLSPEERSFLLEDNYGIDEELDDEKTIRKKKIALKEQVAEARAHLDRQKSNNKRLLIFSIDLKNRRNKRK